MISLIQAIITFRRNQHALLPCHLIITCCIWSINRFIRDDLDYSRDPSHHRTNNLFNCLITFIPKVLTIDQTSFCFLRTDHTKQEPLNQILIRIKFVVVMFLSPPSPGQSSLHCTQYCLVSLVQTVTVLYLDD